MSADVSSKDAIPLPLLRAAPSYIHCPFCKMHTTTTLEYKSGILTYLSAMGCIGLGCVLGCCLIPFCVAPLKDVEHRCSSCRQVIAVYERL